MHWLSQFGPVLSGKAMSTIGRRRPTVSAGALHAVEIVIAGWRDCPRVFRYDPMNHCLEIFTSRNPVACASSLKPMPLYFQTPLGRPWL